jgi:protocatechuate 3,4-dioxygenase beta subunit
MPNYLVPLLFLLISPAQAPQSPVGKPVDVCTVQGVVHKADTGEPLRKASVEMWQEGAVGQRHSAATDSMGRFEFRNLDPGQYQLIVERNGYVRQEYGETKPGGSGTSLTLAAGQTVSNISIQLIPAAIITGHVLDEDGEPVARAQVLALRPVYGSGQREFAQVGESRTNDLGEYRIFGLAPGQYFLEADKQPRLFSALKAEAGYVPIYYPGVSDAAQAAPVSVRAGDELSSADITMRTSSTVTIHGHVISGVSGTPAMHAQVYLVSQGPSSAGSHISSQSLIENAQGAFELGNVAPGAYSVYAFLNEGGRGESARQSLEVSTTDLEGINLTLAPGVDVRGRLRVEGELGSNIKPFQVMLSPRDTRLFANGMPNDAVKRDGSFLLRNVFDDEYEIDVNNLPANYFLKSARLDGIDALTAGFTTDARRTSGLLDILVSPNGASIGGIISKDEQPFPGASVTLVPDPPLRGQMRLYKSTSTDKTGHFVLQGIPPGDYKVFAWESIEPGAYRSSGFLLPFENRGESIHVTEGSTMSVQPDLIPAKDSEH